MDVGTNAVCNAGLLVAIDSWIFSKVSWPLWCCMGLNHNKVTKYLMTKENKSKRKNVGPFFIFMATKGREGVFSLDNVLLPLNNGSLGDLSASTSSSLREMLKGTAEGASEHLNHF